MQRYSIFDPTRNITALVESDVDVADQPRVAADIIRRHPDVEQVGFVRLSPTKPVQAHLRMAGGEFCGNATISAASLFALRTGWKGGTALLGVSGARNPVRVDLAQTGPVEFGASVYMPEAKGMTLEKLGFGTLHDVIPVVHMEGISHAIIQEPSPLFALLNHPADAEKAVEKWCRALDADGLGLMFLEGSGTDDATRTTQRNLTPLVYIPGSNTVFWEHSCASGSSAVGIYVQKTCDSPVSLALHEPGGILRVEGVPRQNTVMLHGGARLVASY